MSIHSSEKSKYDSKSPHRKLVYSSLNEASPTESIDNFYQPASASKTTNYFRLQKRTIDLLHQKLNADLPLDLHEDLQT